MKAPKDVDADGFKKPKRTFKPMNDINDTLHMSMTYHNPYAVLEEIEVKNKKVKERVSTCGNMFCIAKVCDGNANIIMSITIINYMLVARARTQGENMLMRHATQRHQIPIIKFFVRHAVRHPRACHAVRRPRRKLIMLARDPQDYIHWDIAS